MAAHRQGFAKLSLMEKAVLEPSGGISFVGKEPPVDEVRHGELKTKLDEISRQLSEVRAALAGDK